MTLTTIAIDDDAMSPLAVTVAVSCAAERVAGTWLRVVSRTQECHQLLAPAPLSCADTSKRRD